MASVVSIQNSLAAGELSPSLYGRTDLEKWHSGSSTCRNFFVNYRGGVNSRAGLAYVGTCKQQYPIPPRDIPFQFNINQGYVLEFGHLYLRIKFNGGYITEATKTVTSVSGAGLFTTSGVHGYSVGDWVFDIGNPDFNGVAWIVHTTPTTSTFTVTDLYGTVIGSATPSSGGTVARLYTVVSPYSAIDLPYLKYTQSADVMTLTLVNQDTSTEYPPYSLVRTSNTNWTFTQVSYAAKIAAPTGLTIKANSSSTVTTWYNYVVTAVSSSTGEESISSSQVAVQNNDITLFAGSNELAWTAVAGADSYNIYRAPASYSVGSPSSSVFGFIGSSLGPAFTDSNVTPDYTVVPPVHNNPFARGTVLQVVPTAAGTNYSDQTIGYSVTTGTGTGFSGKPVTAYGGLVGFVIANPGQGYLPGDTIGFTDSGGGIATGTITAVSNPPDGGHVFINGTDLTLRSTGDAPHYHEIELGNTGALTLLAIANYCNSSTETSLNCATYTVSGNVMTITYNSIGAVGNAFTIVSGGGSLVCSGATLTGGGTAGAGATATLTIGPQTGTYPSVTNYFQQRQVYGSSLNKPDTYWMSQPGLFTNMDSSIPVTDGDSIIGTPWATQVNGIQFFQPMPGGLITLTGKGAWQVNGGGTAAITPASQNATAQAFNGCSNKIPPIAVNYDILYVQAKGSIVRDLAYNFFTNIYTGTDLTVLSNHLFINKTVVQWAYAEEPYKLIWMVMSDGTMLCLTYLKEQEVYAWTRHDTDGLFVSVCTVTEPPVDAIYVIVQRYVAGAWRYYSERMNNRLWEAVEDSFCVDAGITSPLTFPAATLSPAAPTGTAVTFLASAAVFNSGMVGDVIRVGGGIATITVFNSTTSVTCNINVPITQTVPNDPNNQPVPAIAGNWSLAVPTITVTGLNHLEGKTVAIVADGSVVQSQSVHNGKIVLASPIPPASPLPASLFKIGLPYTCQLQTLYIDHPEGGNTAQNKRKNISAVGVRCEGTRGIFVGADQPDASTQPDFATLPWTSLSEVKDRTMFSFAGNAVPLFTGDYYKAITASWSVKGQIAIQQAYPLPASILSVVAYWDIGDDR